MAGFALFNETQTKMKRPSLRFWKFCHHLLILPLGFFLLLNTKEDILKNDWNFGTSDFHSILFFSTMEVNGAKQLFGSNHTSKYRLLCSAEERQLYR